MRWGKLLFDPDRPQQSQVCERVRELVLAGHLKPGQKLPPTHDLARTLGTARSRSAPYRIIWPRKVRYAPSGSQFLSRFFSTPKTSKGRTPAGALKALQARPGWEAVVALVAAVKRERWEEFRDRHGDWGRELAWYVARRHCGLPLRELGAWAGGVPYAAVGQAIKRFGRRVQTDRWLQEVLQRVEADLLKVET